MGKRQKQFENIGNDSKKKETIYWKCHPIDRLDNVTFSLYDSLVSLISYSVVWCIYSLAVIIVYTQERSIDNR